MSERKPVTKRMRFQVFKRDGFKCQYCGRTPPTVVLEVDHIHPVAKGGKNQSDNLLTACFDCNRGKGAELLSSVPASLIDRATVLREKQDQVKAYSKLLREIDQHLEDLVDRLGTVLARHFKDKAFSGTFRDSIKANFASVLPEDRLFFAMTKACVKCASADAACRYFCGICWNMIRGE